MRRGLLTACVITIAIGIAATGISNSRTDDPLGVAVSPQTLLLGCEQGGSVVVHTFIPYSTVDTATVELNGIAATWTKADDCGYLVAYFDEGEIKAIVSPPSAVLTLTGKTKDGVPFEGSDGVRVIQR